MKFQRGIYLFIVMLLLAIPASAVYEYQGRYYSSGGTSPSWNSEPGLFYVVGGFNASTGGSINDSWISPQGSSGGIFTPNSSAMGWRARYGLKAVPVGAGWIILTGGTGVGMGYGGSNFANDTWMSTDYGMSYANLTATYGFPGWRARQGHMSQGTSSCVLVAGGAGAAGGWGAPIVYNDTWKTLDWGNTWVKNTYGSANATWHARYYGATVSDGANIWMMGGLNATSQTENDVWVTADCGGNWTQVRANTGYGTNPLPRYNHGLVITNNSLVLFGGTYNGGDLNDAWASVDSGQTWVQTTASAPWTPRAGFTYGYDHYKDLIIMAGGATGSTFYNEVWTSADNGATWKPYYSTTYSTPGQYSWTAPAGVYNLTMNLAGSGGGGMGAHCGATYAVGGGGTKGAVLNISKNAVTPGSPYWVSVGLNGTQSAAESRISYQGLGSTAFGKSASGGLGGVMLGEENTNYAAGGTGESTNFLTPNYLAINGSIVLGYAGRGYGAGGGGGGHSGTTPCTAGYGGSGAPGVARIFTEGSWWDNTPEFATTTTASTIGTTIQFIDQTTIRNNVVVYYLWNFGDGTTSTTQASVNHSYAYPGSFTVSLTVGSATGEFITTKEGFIQITGSNSQTWYSPNQVRFTVLDYLGNNIAGATVNATYVQSTLPSASSWLQSVYGVNSQIAAQMLSTNTVMSGLTGDDGAIDFTMHSSLQYNISVWNASSFLSMKLYPKETDYNIWLPKPSVNNTYAQIGYNLTFWEPNASYYTMGATYQDNSSLTQRVTFYVNGSNGTLINYTTLINPGTSLLNITKTIPNTRGESFYYGVNVVRSEPAGKGNISASRGVTSKGASGVMVDLRLPSATYYPWIALFLLFLITALASKGNVRFMAIIIPIMATIFWWFGWMTFSYTAAVVPFACLLGAIFYMKGSLRENYGVGGSGSMLVNIVVFMIILQMMIGFINGIGVFNQAGTMNPSNEFSNVDLLTIQNGTQNFGGINDPIQGAQNYAAIGWATLKIGLDMIGAVFIVGVYLIEMFPYVPREFFLIIQGGIYILYIFFIMKLVGKVGSEVDL